MTCSLPYKRGLSLTTCLLAPALWLSISTPAQAQTFNVIYTFNSGLGNAPHAGVVIDRGGNLYGTARQGGNTHGAICDLFADQGCGAVFKLSLHESAWIYSALYKFSGSDGGYPAKPVTIGPNGSLYGSTALGGSCTSSIYGCGTIFNVRPKPTPPVTSLQPWSEKVLYGFAGDSDGGPYPSAVVFDTAGNLYGTTCCGTYSSGNVFELTLSQGSWTETVLYSFYGGVDGLYPTGLVMDANGNFFGTTSEGGNTECDSAGCGTIFQLTHSGSGWSKSILHVFEETTDGGWPEAPPILDAAGNLFGTTGGGPSHTGTVWELSPTNGGWSFSVLYSFTGFDDSGPYGGLIMDAAGNLYGTSYGNGQYAKGNVFKLTRSNGGWSYSDLYDFTGGNDGCSPEGSVALDSSGNIFSTASACGQNLVGTVWEITP